MTFVFKDDTHQYFLNGKELPSVSAVIEPLTDFSNIPKATLDHKASLGTEFHHSIALYLKDDIDESTIDERLVKPFEAFKKWAVHLRNIVAIEEPSYHKTLGYAGTPDLVVETAIYDFKLRPYQPITDILQLEAYRHMVSNWKASLGWTVCFDLEGNIRTYRSEHPNAWGVFRKLLERWYREQEIENLLQKWRLVA